MVAVWAATAAAALLLPKLLLTVAMVPAVLGAWLNLKSLIALFSGKFPVKTLVAAVLLRMSLMPNGVATLVGAV